jgi:hypothetical protein
MNAQRRSVSARDLLREILTQLGPDVDLLQAQEREWASATFEGARHSFAFSVAAEGSAGAHVARQALALSDHEFALRGEIVADCHASFGGPLPNNHRGIGQRQLIVELLTVNAD